MIFTFVGERMPSFARAKKWSVIAFMIVGTHKIAQVKFFLGGRRLKIMELPIDFA